MRNTLIETLGWYGVIAILSAYTLSSFGVLSTADSTYQILNFTGAVCIVIDALKDRNYQPAVLNTIWAVVALVALLAIVF